MKTPTTRTFPLDRLEIAPSNVRKTPALAEADRELKASILAHGLRQNLVVQIKKDKNGERGLVVAGGRRLAALQALAVEDRIPSDYAVLCSIAAAKDAEEISLAENAVRSAMHPIDEYEAFARLSEAGSSIDQIATRFGATPRQVEQRLKLGAVAPKLREVYRSGGMALADLMAFTLTDDHNRQRTVWKALESERRYNTNGLHHAIRRLLRETTVSANSALGRAITLEAYEAAGGAVIRDLFADNDAVHYDDPALVEKLALEALEAIAEPLRTEWKWVLVELEDNGRRIGSGWWSLDPDLDTSSDEDRTELATLEARMTELENMAEEDWTDAHGEEWDEVAEKIQTCRVQVSDRLTFSAEAKQRSGCIVTLGPNGIVVRDGILNPDDVAEIRAAQKAEDEASDQDGASSSTVSQPSIASLPAAPGKAEPKPVHSAALADDLQAHRVQITAAHLANATDVAFDLALWIIANQVLHLGYRSRPADITLARTHAPSSLRDLDETPAAAMMEATKAQLPLGFLSHRDDAEGFAEMCALPKADKDAIFAYCIAATLKPQLSGSGGVFEAIGTRMGVDLASFWRPTAENYWDRVRKDTIAEIATEVVGDDWGRLRRDEKKGVAAKAMDALFSEGRAVGQKAEVIEAAKAWLPEGMAFETSPDAEQPSREAEPTETDQPSDTADDSVVIPAFLTQAA